MILDFTELALSDTFRVALTMLVGGQIGLEREFRDKLAVSTR